MANSEGLLSTEEVITERAKERWDREPDGGAFPQLGPAATLHEHAWKTALDYFKKDELRGSERAGLKEFVAGFMEGVLGQIREEMDEHVRNAIVDFLKEAPTARGALVEDFLSES